GGQGKLFRLRPAGALECPSETSSSAAPVKNLLKGSATSVSAFPATKVALAQRLLTLQSLAGSREANLPCLCDSGFIFSQFEEDISLLVKGGSWKSVQQMASIRIASI